jgi:hypothetical protein
MRWPVWIPDWELRCCVEPAAVGARWKGQLFFSAGAPQVAVSALPAPPGEGDLGIVEVELTVQRPGVGLIGGIPVGVATNLATGTAVQSGAFHLASHEVVLPEPIGVEGTVCRIRIIAVRCEADGRMSTAVQRLPARDVTTTDDRGPGPWSGRDDVRDTYVVIDLDVG